MMDRLNEMEAHLELLQQSVTALKQELVDGGAPTGSARKGSLNNTERARILARRQTNRMK